jgi:Uncharacterized protein conserved in bacteria
MLTILGHKYRLCDGLSRRDFLGIGGLGVGALALPDILRAEDQVGKGRSHKSVIMVFLPGGPSHLDLFDLKPDAPVEIRGEFKPAATNVSGISICEHLPQLARMMDKLAIVRSIVGGPDDHASHMCFTGYSRLGSQPLGNWPNFGAVASKMLGPVDSAIPPFVGLASQMIHQPYNDPGPGFLGAAHAAFTPREQGLSDLTIDAGRRHRLQARADLLSQFDSLRNRIDTTGMMKAMDSYHQRGLEILASSKLREALDLSREDPKTRALYGMGTPELIEGFNAAPRLTEHFLMARRAVEAGARCVTVAFGAWDWHEKNFSGLQGQLPYLDQGVAALLTDLNQRGLDKDVAVVVWGEFGRSPRINQSAGRDHWPAVSCALLGGGGMRTGQVIGSTTRLGDAAKDRPVHFLEVLATLYRHMGIDTKRAALTDLSGRPRYLVESNEPISELG